MQENIRNILAIMTVGLCFSFFFCIAFLPHARTQDTVVVGVVTALVAILPQVLGYYFGQSKRQDEPTKKNEVDLPGNSNNEIL